MLLGGRKDYALLGLRFDLAERDRFARARPGIGALEAVDADDLQPFVLEVRIDRARRRRAFADALDHAPFGERALRHQRARQVREPAPRLLGPRVGALGLVENGRPSCMTRDVPYVSNQVTPEPT